MPKQNSNQNYSDFLNQAWNISAAESGEQILLAFFETSPVGLDQTEAKRRQVVFGLNEPAKAEKENLFRAIVFRFSNPLIVLLLLIATFSIFFGDKLSAIIIYIMAVASVVLTFIQEHKAERAAEDLQALVRTTVEVFRDGQIRQKPVKELVPGDIVSLAAGDIVPADLRLLESRDLYLNQSSLTGESLPVEKNALNPSGNSQSPLAAPNLAFMGSAVVSGTAKALVMRTGLFTQFGQLSKKLAEIKVETNFDIGIRKFTWLMIRAIVVMVFIILAINAISKHNFFESLLFALAVAVGLAPETLPMIVTVNLSKGALNMSRKKVVVKRLDSIQNFGAMDVLCTDKTGTLTLDQVVLEKHCDTAGQESDDVLQYGYINSFYQTGLRNLLDKAVLKHQKLHLHNLKKIDEIPFDFQRKLMSVVVEKDKQHLLITKGAPENVFVRCTHYEQGGKIIAFKSNAASPIEAEYRKLSQEGFRVLAVAYKQISAGQKAYTDKDEQGLILKGYMAFLDPPKPTAKQTIESLEKSGIILKVLTGDNELVTRKICEEIGLNVENLLTGEMLENKTNAELVSMVEKGSVFARLQPLQKQQIIELLHKNGHTVGYLGDGINDAPALKAADVGISVNNAADVAKESASIILLKKSLVVLNEGVLEGRKVFGNIMKYIRMASSSNFGNMLSVTGASLFLPFLPMAPVQILLNNFLYDVSQIGIPTDEVDPDYLQQPRPWNIGLIEKFMVIVGPVSSIFDFATFGAMWWLFGGQFYADPIRGQYYQNLFHTGWFLESLLTQTVVIYIIRTRKIPFLQSRPSKLLVLTTVSVLLAGFLIPYTFLGKFFGFVRPPMLYFGTLFVILVLYLALVQVVKQWFFARFEKE